MEFLVAALDLLRVEARSLRRWVASLWVELVLIAVAGGLLLIGFGLLGAGVFLMFRSLVGTAPAALITGALALIVSGVLMWIVRMFRT